MGSPLDSAVGIALQAAKGTAITMSSSFQYLLFERGTISPAEIQRAYGRLAGSLRSLPRGSIKTGVYSGGDIDFVGAPECVGWYLLGLMGEAASASENGTLYDHVFSFASDEFSLPYFTIRKRTAGLWHEQFQDIRIASFTVSAPATDMVRFNVGMVGINPQKVANSDWAPASYLDDGVPFLTCTATLTSPAYGTFKATNITLVQTGAIALDEEWIVGSYYPDDLTLGGRAFLIDCILHATDEIFGKMVYDPDYVATTATWTPEILSDGAFALQLDTQEDEPQSLAVAFDTANNNIDWIMQPVVIDGRVNKQLMRVIGTVKQSAGTQVAWTLTNDRSTDYA